MNLMLFLKDEKGATLIEYGIVIGVIALLTFVAWKNLGEVVGRIVKKIVLQFLW